MKTKEDLRYKFISEEKQEVLNMLPVGIIIISAEYTEWLEDIILKQINVDSINKSSDLLSDVEYWKTRCVLMEEIEKASPCDPDITPQQIKSYNAYNKFISHYGKKE